MSNILEQEDYIKGLPDSELQRMVEQPDGQIPDFLPLSEINRRTEMRKNYEATAQPQMPSIRDNIMAQGLASAAPQRSSTPPAYPTSALPVDGGMQGSGGMGVQGYNTGGVIRMQEAGRVPYGEQGGFKNYYTGKGYYEGSSQDTPDHYKGRAILEEKGLDWRDYDDAYVNGVGKRGGTLGIIPPRFMSSRDDDEYQRLFGEETLVETEEPAPEVVRPSTQEMINRYDVADRLNIDPRDNKTRRERAAEETESRYADPERYPYSHLSPFEQESLGFGQRNALRLREGIAGVYDFLSPNVAAAGGEGADAITSLITGSTSDPVEQREDALDALKETYVDNLEDINQSRLSLGRNSFSMPENITDVFANELQETGDDVVDFIERYQENPTDTMVGRFAEKIANRYIDSESQQANETVTETNAFRADSGRGDASSADVSGGETGDRGVDSLLNFDSLMNPSENFDYLEDMQNRFGTEVQGGAYGVNPNQALQDEAYAELLTGQGDVSDNLRGLIDQTRADSKQQAFYLGMAALGAGIAKGDMGGGMQEAVNIASATTARGQDAVAPLEAALVTQGTQGPKDRIEALASMARSDAAFQQVKADILRQGRMDQQSVRTLRAATLQAVTRIVQESGGFLEGVETPQQVADFIRTVAGQLSSEVESQIQAPTSRLTTNPETERLRFTAP
tara:strand:+ start:1451 stop:3496 length:2046 start_codon:yes stop_codon:yes gene_type:complete